MKRNNLHELGPTLKSGPHDAGLMKRNDLHEAGPALKSGPRDAGL